jgi:membrane protease YdiL (CAAX protease family)
LPSVSNPLIHNAYRPIPGWSLLLFIGVCAAICLPAVGFIVWFQPELTLLPVSGAMYGIGLFAVAVAVAPFGPAALPALGLRSANWKYPVFGALATIALSVAVSQIGIEPQGMKRMIEVVREPGQIVPSLLLLAVLAPIVEELIFRGLLYGWIAGRWGTMPAFLVSSLAFAAAHGEPAHAVLVLPLGLLFGWMRRRTDSLLPSTVAHIFNNGFALLAAIYLPDV